MLSEAGNAPPWTASREGYAAQPLQEQPGKGCLCAYRPETCRRPKHLRAKIPPALSDSARFCKSAALAAGRARFPDQMSWRAWGVRPPAKQATENAKQRGHV